MIKKIFLELIDKKFNAIFRQLDMIIINFGMPVQYSIHIDCMVRITYDKKIIFTAADEFFNKEGLTKSDEYIKFLEEKGILNDPDSLAALNLKWVNELLNNCFVKNIKFTKWGDIFLIFNNGVTVQIYPDCLKKDMEYYRLIKFVPYLSDDDFKSEHFIVSNANGKIRAGWESGD